MLLNGVLGWGLSVGVASAIGMAAVRGWDRLPVLLPLALVLFPIGGCGFGLSMWRKSEALYSEALREQPRG